MCRQTYDCFTTYDDWGNYAYETNTGEECGYGAPNPVLVPQSQLPVR